MKFVTTLMLALVTVGQAAPFGAHEVPGIAAAGQALTSSANVDRILDRYLLSIGGGDALRKLTTRRMKGRVSQAASRLTGQLQIDQKALGKWLEVESFRFAAPPPNDHSERRMGFNGKTGWSGNDDLDAATVAERSLVFDLERPLRLRGIYRNLKLTSTLQIEADHPNLEYRGADDVKEDLGRALARAAGGPPPTAESYVIEAMKTDGGIDKLYFDTKLGLLRRCDLATAPGQYGLTWYLEDYRDVGSVKVPYRLIYRQNFSGNIVDTVFQFREVYDNIEIPDAEFERPGAKP